MLHQAKKTAARLPGVFFLENIFYKKRVRMAAKKRTILKIWQNWQFFSLGSWFAFID